MPDQRTTDIREPDAVIASLASSQHGVVSAPQLHRLGIGMGLIRSRLRRHSMHRVYPGVYSVGHTALSRSGQFIAACLAVREDAVVARYCAAELWGMVKWPARTLQVLTPGHSHATIDADVRRTTTLHPEDVAVVDGIRVTSVARTLVDLGASVTAHRLANLMHEAEYLGILELDALYGCAHRNRSKRGYRTVLEAAALRRSGSAGLRSGFEAEFLRDCQRSGLPEPMVNVTVPIGDTCLELDFHWPEARVCAEADGPGHSRARCQLADEERDRLLATAGYRVLRFTLARYRRQRGEVLDAVWQLLRTRDRSA